MRRHQQMLRVTTAFGLALATAGLSAQTLLPSTPKKGFGASVTPAYDGWYENADGSKTLLVGYYNRNWKQEVDIPIGPANHFEPGDPDRGQPTHFVTNRAFGMFTITVPKTFGPTERLWWVLTENGVTSRVGLILSPDYNITPQHASEESPNGKYNVPPLLRFAADGPSVQSPAASLATAIQRRAVAGEPMTLDLWTEDDALYSSGSNAPMGARMPPVVEFVVAKYRGPGTVTVGKDLDHLTVIRGGKPMEPFAGKASTTVTFSEPGDYVLHVTANDYSGKGGGATGCCWTTAMVKVSVSAGVPRQTGQQ